MKCKFWLSILTFSILTVLNFGCKDDPEEEEPKKEDVINKYAGSGSKGDLVTFSINTTDKTYSVNNETTGKSSDGSYTIKSGAFYGIYEINTNSNRFFAVELNKKVIAANFPTGNEENNISFGVSSSISYLNNSSVVAGDYTWIIITNKEIDGSTMNKEWGVLSVNSNGTWIKKNHRGGVNYMDAGYSSPVDFNQTLPLTGGHETGTWSVNAQHPERLNVQINGVSQTLTGYIYGDSQSGAILLDLGTGNGFLLGIKNNNASLADIAHTYNFVDVWNTGYKGAGNYIISSNGTVNFNHITTGGEQTAGSFQIQQCNVLKNTYYCQHATIDSYDMTVYLVVCGDIIMHFMFNNENGGFIAYGAGGKIQ